MSIVGRRVRVVDEETGTAVDYRFVDTPLTRWVGALFEVAEKNSMPMGAWTLLWELASQNQRGADLREVLKLKPMKDGLAYLIERGWINKPSKRTKRVRLRNLPEIHEFFRQVDRLYQKAGACLPRSKPVRREKA
jgi:hypothetical protein